MDENLKNFYVLYGRRRSIREFDGDVIIEDVVLERLLNVLRRAQSAANRQPWRFVLVKREENEEFGEVFTEQGFKEAPVWLVACTDPKEAWIRQADNVNYAWVDATIAVSEMIGAATAEGVGTCWVAAFDPDHVRRLLDIPRDLEVVGIIVMGYAREELRWVEKDRKHLDEIVYYGKWKG